LSEGIETERTGKKIEKIVTAERKDREDRIEGVDDEAKAEGAGKGGVMTKQRPREPEMGQN
jgi:hypothetical protein